MEIVHSQIIQEDGIKKVYVNFERPTEQGFDSARCELPNYKWIEKEGYLDGEPIHVHVSKGKPSPNATKIWLTRAG